MMGMLKIEEAINTWIVSDELDRALTAFKKLPAYQQRQLIAMTYQLQASQESLGKNVIHLKKAV